MFSINANGLMDLVQKNNLLIKMLERGDPMEELVKRIVRSAKRFAPRDTGELVRSINYKKISSNKFMITVNAVNNKGEPYPMYLEFGTKYIKIGTDENPRRYKTTSGKLAHLPYVGSAIWRSTRQKDIDAIAEQMMEVYNKR